MTAALFVVGVLITLMAVAGMILMTSAGAVPITESASNLSGAPDETADAAELAEPLPIAAA